MEEKAFGGREEKGKYGHSMAEITDTIAICFSLLIFTLVCWCNTGPGSDGSVLVQLWRLTTAKVTLSAAGCSPTAANQRKLQTISFFLKLKLGVAHSGIARETHFNDSMATRFSLVLSVHRFGLVCEASKIRCCIVCKPSFCELCPSISVHSGHARWTMCTSF